MNIWIEKSLVKGRPDREFGERALGKALWSPRADKRGGDIYKNMRKVMPEDIVIHLINNREISGISIVKRGAINTDGVSDTNWNSDSYLIELKGYTKLESPIDRESILNDQNKEILEEISSESEVFYTYSFKLRQGAYLTPCPPKLAGLINQTYKKQNSKDLPYFNNMDLEPINLNDNISTIPFIPPKVNEPETIIFDDNIDFKANEFKRSLNDAGLIFSSMLITRFIASLLTKPFVILTGLSGSGKTKLAQAFVQWICEDENQYRIVPVGADWTNREPLLGYVNALCPDKYVFPENSAVELIIEASKVENIDIPYFLILDEMNLSHVERYFADFLSVMESKDKLKLHSSDEPLDGEDGIYVAKEYVWPENLFVLGTVNIDETTNMFSPKVLDRANTIEFRINDNEMESFLDSMNGLKIEALYKKGANMAVSFLELSKNKSFTNKNTDSIKKTLLKFFGELKKTGAEFGYRSATEIMQLIYQLGLLDTALTTNEKIDIAIMQKLLPKLHGSRRKLCPILEVLSGLCVTPDIKVVKDVFEKEDFNYEDIKKVHYPLSLEKIARMYRGAIDNGFTSYAEA